MITTATKKKLAMAGWSAAAVTLLGALVLGRRGSTGRRVGCVVGWGGIMAASAVWFAVDRQDREITRNPETMNGHFLTAGQASAMTGSLADVDVLRSVVGSRALAVVGRGKRGRRGNRL